MKYDMIKEAISYEKLANEVYKILKSVDGNIDMFKEDGSNAIDPSKEARRFFLKTLNVMVSLNEEGNDTEIKVYLGSDNDIMKLKELIKTLRQTSIKFGISIDVKKFNKVIQPKDFALDAYRTKQKQMEESKLNENLKSVSTPSAAELAKKYNKSISEINKLIQIGAEIEKEHTTDENEAAEIARDHLGERIDYYKELEKIEGSDMKLDEAKSKGMSASKAKQHAFDKMKKATGPLSQTAKNMEAKKEDKKEKVEEVSSAVKRGFKSDAARIKSLRQKRREEEKRQWAEVDSFGQKESNKEEVKEDNGVKNNKKKFRKEKYGAPAEGEGMSETVIHNKHGMDRKDKKNLRKMGMDDKVYDAYHLGLHHAANNYPKKNPFPPGKRHDEYERAWVWVTGPEHVKESKDISNFHGSTRSSYQNFGSQGRAKMIVRHSTPVDEDKFAARSRNIKHIFIENSIGERIKFPVNYLQGARAMTRHISSGGTFNDNVGNYILENAKRFTAIKSFITNTRKGLNESNQVLFNSLLENARAVHETMKRLQGPLSYKRFVENFVASESNAEDYTPTIKKFRSTFALNEEFLDEDIASMVKVLDKNLLNELKDPVETGFQPGDEEIHNTPIDKVYDELNAGVNFAPSKDRPELLNQFRNPKDRIVYLVKDLSVRAQSDVISNFLSRIAEKLENGAQVSKDELHIVKELIKQVQLDKPVAESKESDEIENGNNEEDDLKELKEFRNWIENESNMFKVFEEKEEKVKEPDWWKEMSAEEKKKYNKDTYKLYKNSKDRQKSNKK